MGRPFTDRWGVPVQAASERGVVLLDEAIEALVALACDPVAGAAEAVAADDELVLGHIYRAYLLLYGMSAQGVASAGRILKRLEGAGGRAGEREALHLQAARSWAIGEWEAAARALERALLRNPRDLLALKVAQDLYFFLGNRLDLRDVAARVMPAWPPGAPGWGYVQGIYAFGLEENADYRQAESRARAALHHNPRDVWAVHALAHVFEMEGSQQEGVAFLAASARDWSVSYFAVHNWWHRALYHLELGEIDQVCALYDGSIRGNRSTEWLDIVDAAALLWRLSLFGVDVTGRAGRLAADIDPLVGEPAEPDAQVPGHERGSDLIAGGQRAQGVEQRAWRRVLPTERGVGVGAELVPGVAGRGELLGGTGSRRGEHERYDRCFANYHDDPLREPVPHEPAPPSAGLVVDPPGDSAEGRGRAYSPLFLPVTS